MRPWCRLKVIVTWLCQRALTLSLLLAVLAPAAQPQAHGGALEKRTGALFGGSKGQTAPSPPRKAAPLLPPAFAGEPHEGDIVIEPTPADADPAHAAVLKEDGLVEASTARYSGMGAASWTVEVLRFGDATGAFAAFTFFRDPMMHPEALGDKAAADPALYLVQKKTALVMVRKTGTAGDAAQLQSEMEALVQGLPYVGGPEGVLPSLPGLLPAGGLQKQTVHYAIGPAGYNGPIPVSAIDFSRDAEVATAAYRLRSGATGTLTLVMLPTPQIAGTSLRTVAGLPDASLHVATRRSGPLVGVVSGQGVSQADAQRLLNEIHYVADLTLDQPQGYTSEVAKAAKLLLGIGYLTVFLAIAAVVIAVFLGAGRVFVRRMRGKPDSSLNDDDFITLKL